MKKYMLFIIPIYLVYVFGYFYVVLPPLNWHAPEFWQFLIFTRRTNLSYHPDFLFN